MDSQFSILRTIDPVFDFKKCTCDKICFSQEKCMYAKVSKTMGTCVPVGTEINGYWGKTMGNIPGMQR